MAQVALDFVGNLGLTQLDLLGYSLGRFVAQVMMARRPDLVRKAILVDTGPAGGEGMDGIWDTPGRVCFCRTQKAASEVKAVFHELHANG